jgi:putative ABC transport system permease protein
MFPFQSILEQSLLLFPLICAIYFSYVILKITDVSVDGSMVLGAAVTAKLLLGGYNPFISILAAMLCGFVAGACVALVQYKNSVNDIIAGLLMSFILYSVNLNVMGMPHLMTMHSETIVRLAAKLNNENKKMIVVMMSSLLTVMFIFSLMHSRLGLKLRGFGENRDLMEKLGFKPEFYRVIGLGMSGCMASLSGSLMCQIYGYSDINMGIGMAITAIGALVIGMHLINKIGLFRMRLMNHSTITELFGCFVGIFCYFSITNTLVLFEVNPVNFKLILGLIIIVFLKLARKSGTAN